MTKNRHIKFSLTACIAYACRMIHLRYVIPMVMLAITAEAQQTPFLAHYYQNNYLINPASAGDLKLAQASLLWRQQWVGIPGAPETQALIINGLVPEKKIGLGINIVNDETNIISRFSGLLSASYRVDFESAHHLSFGMSAGFMRYQVDFDKIRGDVADAALLSNNANVMRVEGAAGIVYRYNKFLFGVVSEQLFRRSFSFVDQPGAREVTFRLARHYSLYAAYTFSINSDVTVQPMVLMRSAQGLPSSIDFNTTLNFREKAWLNVQHRPKAATGISLGAMVTDRFALSYGYEISASPIAKSSSGSHELMLSMKFINARSRQESNSKKEPRRRAVGGDAATLEQMDELRQKNELLNEALIEQKKLIEDQIGEMQVLKRNLDNVQSEMRLMVEQSSIDLEAEKVFDASAEYVLVIGATKKLSEARAYQRMIQRETGLTTYVRQNSLQSWYFIYSDVLKSNEDARQKMKALHEKNISSLILGNPWIYKSKKASEKP